MASSDTPPDNTTSYESIVEQEKLVYDFWRSTPTEEPVSDEMKQLVRADLRRAWHYERLEEFRENTKIMWWTPIDSYRIVLEDKVGRVESNKWKYLCNKATALYWLESAQTIDAKGERTLIPNIIFACMFEEWYRCYDSKPNIEFEHFLANPIRITSTGPSTISAILDAHSSLCAQASDLANDAKIRTRNQIDEQHPSNARRYSLVPLYKAIVMIVDRPDVRGKQDRDADGFLSLYKICRIQTVLIACTGHNEGLSAPISLQELKSQSLPLERTDIENQEANVVRVYLHVAVQFIVDLERREELASSTLNNKSPRDRNICPSPPKGFEGNPFISRNPDSWADAVLTAAEKYGYDNIDPAWRSIRRVTAAKFGEEFLILEPVLFRPRWKVK